MKTFEMAGEDYGYKSNPMPTTPNSKTEDTKGGVCSKCGAWKGGDYGMNGRGEESHHLCIKNSFTEKTLAEFDEKFPANFVECDGKNNITRESSLPHDLRDIKSFLRSALNAQREEMVKKINQVKNPFEGKLGEKYDTGYENCRNHILSILSPNNKENE